MAFGHEWGRTLSPNDVICFFGDLGAGKTTFIKGLVEGATGLSTSAVRSPTFTYLNIYEGTKPVYHFDLYRLKHESQFLEMGFDEYFEAGGICCIEWAEKIPSLLPSRHTKCLFTHLGEDQRQIECLL